MSIAGVGGPKSRLLDQWGDMIHSAFGVMPYLVGSANETKDWHDVDVRVIIPDTTFLQIFRRLPQPHSASPIWRLVCDAMSAWGQAFTGLPIDFQVQPQSLSDEKFKGRPRHALFHVNDWDTTTWEMAGD